MTKKTDVGHLLTQHHSEAWQWARQCCHYQREFAEEVLQTAYVKVLEGSASLRKVSAFKPWLFGIIRYTTLELWRKERAHYPLEAAMMVSLPESEDDNSAYYESVIRQLPDRQAEVLLLVFYHHLTLETAAEVMKISPGTASTHYARGKQKLAELLKKSNVETPIL